jgi:membrane-bound lytic murein transglycosylase F
MRDAPVFALSSFAARRRWAAIAVVLGALALSGCTLFEKNLLQKIKADGELVVLTRQGPTTYFESPEGPAGLEYDLAKAFADRLGVKLRLVAVDHFVDILPKLSQREAHFAAAGITVTESRKAQFRFTPPYQETRLQAVGRLGATEAADTICDLIKHRIEIDKDTSYAELLTELQKDYPRLAWVEVEDKHTEELLQHVAQGLTDMTVAHAHAVSVQRQFFPELRVTLELGGPRHLAWAFPQGSDDSLYQAASQHIEGMKKSGDLAQLIDRYYGPASRSSYVNMTVYRLRVETRLPQYQQLFVRAGKKHKLDWRLLAAMGYQESYWDPKAVSPTGVRGMMMLTEETAQQLKIKNRLDPRQSIDGGARYINQMIARIPETVTGPDRLWMALAAYNVGLYHLEDARVLTQKLGGDPNKWNDVKERLPLLATAKWGNQAKYGMARGNEAVVFVNRIRTYYDVLVNWDETEKKEKRSDAIKLKAPAI